MCLFISVRDWQKLQKNLISKEYAKTKTQLYIGAGDTLTNSMRWMCLILSIHQDVQQKCFTELDACYEAKQKYDEKLCPYVQATLEEVFRFRPVSDSLPHLTATDVEIDGVQIKKGTVIMGSFTAIQHNPNNFENPSLFKPERFLSNGRFVRNPKVCLFGVGPRNCVGKKLAQMEFFSFASHVLHKLRLIHVRGDLNPAEHSNLLKPGDFRVQFVPR